MYLKWNLRFWKSGPLNKNAQSFFLDALWLYIVCGILKPFLFLLHTEILSDITLIVTRILYYCFFTSA